MKDSTFVIPGEVYETRNPARPVMRRFARIESSVIPAFAGMTRASQTLHNVSPALHVEAQEIRWQGPFPILQASHYNLSARITPEDLPNDLPVEVKGLNPNWDAGVYDLKEHRLRRMGVFQNTGYFTADITHGLDFAAGNLLISDQPKVHLHLWVSLVAGKGGSALEVEAHNPIAHPRMTEIWPNPAVPWLQSIHILTRLRAGESRTFTFSLTQRLRWTERGVMDTMPGAH